MDNISFSNQLTLVNYKPLDDEKILVFYSSSARRFFIDNYPHPLFHNKRSDGKSLARGSRIQFKVINGELYILGIGEGAEFLESFHWPDQITFPIGYTGKKIIMSKYLVDVINADFEETDFMSYRTLTPYLALNQSAYEHFKELGEDERRIFIEQRLQNHILSAAKWCGVWLNHRVKTQLIQMRRVKSVEVKKSLKFVGMDVMFETNTHIPDFIGIGRFVSRGYGTVVKYG